MPVSPLRGDGVTAAGPGHGSQVHPSHQSHLRGGSAPSSQVPPKSPCGDVPPSRKTRVPPESPPSDDVHPPRREPTGSAQCSHFPRTEVTPPDTADTEDSPPPVAEDPSDGLQAEFYPRRSSPPGDRLHSTAGVKSPPSLSLLRRDLISRCHMSPLSDKYT